MKSNKNTILVSYWSKAFSTDIVLAYSDITIDYKTELGALGAARLLLSTGVEARRKIRLLESPQYLET